MKEGAPEIGIYTWHCSKKCEKLQPFSRLLSLWTLVYYAYICWRSTVHSALFSWKASQMPTLWARLLHICERYSHFYSQTLHAVFAKHKKTWNNDAENGSNVGRENITNQTFKGSLTRARNKYFEPRRLIAVCLRGHVDPSCLSLMSSFSLSFRFTIRAIAKTIYA